MSWVWEEREEIRNHPESNAHTSYTAAAQGWKYVIIFLSLPPSHESLMHSLSPPSLTPTWITHAHSLLTELMWYRNRFIMSTDDRNCKPRAWIFLCIISLSIRTVRYPPRIMKKKKNHVIRPRAYRTDLIRDGSIIFQSIHLILQIPQKENYYLKFNSTYHIWGSRHPREWLQHSQHRAKQDRSHQHMIYHLNL